MAVAAQQWRGVHLLIAAGAQHMVSPASPHCIAESAQGVLLEGTCIAVRCCQWCTCVRVKVLGRDLFVWLAGSLHGSRGFTDVVSTVASILESEQPPKPGSMLVSSRSCQPTA